MRIPQYLKKGDTVGICCPAGYMDFENAKTAIDVIQKEWGLKTIIGKTLGGLSKTYFSGTDAERLADMQAMLDNPNIKAILFARGGYGCSRLVDELDWTICRKNPKWLIGFSDITVFHAYAHRQLKLSTIHGPMCAAFNNGLYKKEYVQSLKDALWGKNLSYSITAHKYNRVGKVTAPIVGGNLSLLAHLTGSNAQVNMKDKILVIEEVGEQIYNVDRMLLNLKRSGQLAGLAGLVVGSFNDEQNTTRPFGKTSYQVVQEHVAEYDYPVAFNFPVGHTPKNYALRFGQEATLAVGKQVQLTQKK
jgi:muramoyltetrapeptide carboxypeptidase